MDDPQFPQPGDTLFGPPDVDGADVDVTAELGWQKASLYAYSYARSARALFRAVADGRTSEDGLLPDHAALPILFLWRHSIELRLKRLIHGLRLLRGEEPGPPLGGHGIGKLWALAKPILVPHESLTPERLRAMDRVIGQLDSYDPEGMTFRYATKLPSKRRRGDAPEAASDELLVVKQKVPFKVNLRELDANMSRLDHYLDLSTSAVWDTVYAGSEAADEAEREAE